MFYLTESMLRYRCIGWLIMPRNELLQFSIYACPVRIEFNLDSACLGCLNNILNCTDYFICCACFERLNSSLDYVCLGYPKSVQN